MKIQHPLLVRAVGVAGAWLVRRLVGSCRYPLPLRRPRGQPRGRPPDRPALHLRLLPRGHALPGLLLGLAGDADPDQRPPRRRADHPGRPPARVRRRPGLDHPGRRPGPPRDDPPGRPGPPLRHARRPAGPRRHVHQGLAYLVEPDRPADRRRRDGLPRPLAGRRAGTASPSPGRSRPPPASSPSPCSSPPTPTARRIEACRLEVERRMQAGAPSRPRRGSRRSVDRPRSWDPARRHLGR